MEHVNRILKLAAVTGELLRRAQLSNTQKQASAQEITSLAKQAADMALKHDRIAQGQEEKVATALQDHAETLRFLSRVCQHRNSDELAVGTLAGQTKTAEEQRSRPASRAVDAPVSNYDNTPAGQRFRRNLLNR